MVNSTHLVRNHSERELVERYRRVASKAPSTQVGFQKNESQACTVPPSSYDLKAAGPQPAAEGRIDITV